ncbi:hypothetical protein HOP50_03g23630 [Chloropicon primus]|uniref:Armadillo-like repeats domain-containing protein n=1 Tax=Chloropicon primus TaxID=1764295 RepID=A0A5B8MHE2_9CHLO|nr:hypothetical protein A3770_03p23650 [Chloropicon primus]UPQ99057.1 hypothetical protein HOP50_03g23630 [Chloropicon primus]|eukprot:QDZ19847.1 hypothetical protein A3770_03p23650 [Chloropicon primus]
MSVARAAAGASLRYGRTCVRSRVGPGTSSSRRRGQQHHTMTTWTLPASSEAGGDAPTAEAGEAKAEEAKAEEVVVAGEGGQPAAEGAEVAESGSEDELDWLAEGEEEEEANLSQKFVRTIVEPIKDRPAVRNVLALASMYFVGTFLWSTFKVVRKMASPRAKKRRQVNKNLTVIQTLNDFLPQNRAALNAKTLEKIRYTTTFSYDLIFRKYLRYLLNERKFDAEAVSDLLHLKATCQLTDDQMKEVMREIAQRTFKKYGILMTETAGLTADAVMKKAAERSIFSKLLYLAELPELVTQEADITNNLSWQIQEIFGSTSEDTEKLRITTLSELEAEDMEALFALGDADDEEEDVEESGEEAAEVSERSES